MSVSSHGRVVRTRYAVQTPQTAPSVRLPDDYADELRQAEAARRLREAYVEEVANRCRSVAEVPLVESDGATKTTDFMEAYLRRNDAVLNVKRRGVPFLSKIIYHNETEALRVLLNDSRVDVNAVSDVDEGSSVLMDACVDGNANAVRLLLQRGDLDVNAQDDEGRTALYEAAWQGDVDIVRMLLVDGRADTDARAGRFEWTAVDAAVTSCLETQSMDDERFAEFSAVIHLLVVEYNVDFKAKKMAAFFSERERRKAHAAETA